MVTSFETLVERRHAHVDRAILSTVNLTGTPPALDGKATVQMHTPPRDTQTCALLSAY